MNKNKIKARLIEKEGSIDAVAYRIRERRSQVSATINYLRLNLRIRQKLIRTYGVKFSPYIQTTKSTRKPKQVRAVEPEAL